MNGDHYNGKMVKLSLIVFIIKQDGHGYRCEGMNALTVKLAGLKSSIVVYITFDRLISTIIIPCILTQTSIKLYLVYGYHC